MSADAAPNDPAGRVVGTVDGSLAGSTTAFISTIAPIANGGLAVTTVNTFATLEGNLLFAKGSATWTFISNGFYQVDLTLTVTGGGAGKIRRRNRHDQATRRRQPGRAGYGSVHPRLSRNCLLTDNVGSNGSFQLAEAETEIIVANYVLVYKGGKPSMTQSGGQCRVGRTWFGQLGGAVVEGGNPFGPSKTVGSGGAAVSDGAASKR